MVSLTRPNAADANHEPLQENLERLRAMTDRDGRLAARSSTLPMPAPVVFDGQRLPASYANFYIANGLVLVPTFNDPNDRVALGILAELFPDRAGGRHPRGRSGVGTRHAALPDPAAARVECRPSGLTTLALARVSDTAPHPAHCATAGRPKAAGARYFL